MSVPFSGTFTRSSGVISSISKQIKLVNLKPVKRIVYKYNPFDHNTKHIRDFCFFFSAKSVVSTNPRCIVKSEINNNNSAPVIEFHLTDGQNIILKANNLTTDELVKAYNKYITPLAPKEETITTVATKSTKPSKGRK